VVAPTDDQPGADQRGGLEAADPWWKRLLLWLLFRALDCAAKDEKEEQDKWKRSLK
jgi:hypothetical protein